MFPVYGAPVAQVFALTPPGPVRLTIRITPGTANAGGVGGSVDVVSP